MVTTRELLGISVRSYLTLIQEVQVNHERCSNGLLWKLSSIDQNEFTGATKKSPDYLVSILQADMLDFWQSRRHQ
jgi:hypothetical protein